MVRIHQHSSPQSDISALAELDKNIFALKFVSRLEHEMISRLWFGDAVESMMLEKD